MRRILPVLAAAALFALVGCGSSTPPAGTSTAVQSTPAGAGSGPASQPGTSAAAVKVADSPLGKIMVNADGMTLYVFDKDTPGAGKSACSGQCAAIWPAALVTGTPTGDGTTGTLGTIKTADGKQQLTVGGRPLYLFAQDSAAGATAGQGFMNIWWVVGPDGVAIKTAPASSSTSAATQGTY